MLPYYLSSSHGVPWLQVRVQFMFVYKSMTTRYLSKKDEIPSSSCYFTCGGWAAPTCLQRKQLNGVSHMKDFRPVPKLKVGWPGWNVSLKNMRRNA